MIAVAPTSKTIEISNNLSVHLKELETNKPNEQTKVSRRKEITKVRAEIIERETKNTIQKIKETELVFLKSSTKLTKL